MKSKKEKIPVLEYIGKMIMYRPWYYLLNCFLWITIHMFPLIPGLITKRFFEVLEKSGGLNSEILSLMALILVVALTRSIIIAIGGRVDANHRFSMSGLLRRNLLECIINNPLIENKTSLGESMNCFRDDIEEIETVISFTLDIIGDGLFALGALIILLTINVKVTLFIFAPLVIVILLSQKAMKYISKYRTTAREATGDVSGAIGEIFTGIQAIKISGSEKYIINNLNNLNEKRMKYMVRDKIFVNIMDAIYENAVTIGTGFILLLTGKYMLEGSFSVGDFSLFLYYLPFVADFAGFLGEIFARYQQGGIAFKRMFKLLDENMEKELLAHNSLYLKGELIEEKCNQEDIEFKSLEVKELTYKYNETSGIENINLRVNKGDFVVVTGRIGAGKTTLIKSILGMLPVDSGKIYLNNEEVKNNSEKLTPPIVAYTSQNSNLFSDTIKNNILLGLKDEGGKLEQAIYSAVLDRDIKNFKEGIDTLIGSKGVKLSGGQRQRVAVARMFARKADLYVFDDISSALDIETEIKLWDRMFERKNITALVVSNRHVALKNADKILVMKDGKIEGQGKLEELLKNCEEMRQIWGLEA
ncbi:MAG: ABC transporter ATP-binding protein [Clostridium sulfidigenes]|uniref:ABC transporter ATP-binding protein n=1 Tax=Clostridium sulfidigenes TaxID=318464 RepID=A0A927W551_9CLOT|nr:ABC transporter ATP-binding protein [Clostridium sulfidigenes]